jgi:transposase InsO family protein
VTFYFDVFTKEMLTHRCAERRGDRKQYIEGLEDVKLLLKGQTEPVYLHTDQGSVYSSIAYNELIKDTVIIRSMSRAGKPTDNPVNEALNGWIKEELYTDFKIVRCKQMSEIMDCLDQYQIYYNERRPCYAIGYDTPVNYRKRFYKGEIPKKETFCNRELSEIPKFVRVRKDEIDNQ